MQLGRFNQRFLKNGVTNAANAVKNTAVSAYNTVRNAITGTTTQKVANTSSAAAKKPYTATLTPGTFRSSTYTSGAANAAQIAKISNTSGKPAANIVRSVLSNSYRPLQDDDPDPIEWIADMLDKFNRRVCDANTKYLETQLELEQAEMQVIRTMVNKIHNANAKQLEMQ